MIKKLNYNATIGELPTSYMISLTYEEQLIEINKKLNELIDAINKYSYEEIQKLIDSSIAELKEYVDKKDEMIYNYVDEKDIKVINELTELINEKVSFLQFFNFRIYNVQIALGIFQYVSWQQIPYIITSIGKRTLLF